MAELSLGVLIDIVDEEWMRDTLPDDGTTFCFASLAIHYHACTYIVTYLLMFVLLRHGP